MTGRGERFKEKLFRFFLLMCRCFVRPMPFDLTTLYWYTHWGYFIIAPRVGVWCIKDARPVPESGIGPAPLVLLGCGVNSVPRHPVIRRDRFGGVKSALRKTRQALAWPRTTRYARMRGIGAREGQSRGMAQLVARLHGVQEVGSSSLPTPTLPSSTSYVQVYPAPERSEWCGKATGSSPVSPTLGRE